MDKDKLIKFLKLATYMADLFSKDPSTKVGAITVEPNTLQIKSIGYNGLPRKIKDTPERWTKPLKYNYVVHAEANMICNASLNSISLSDSILFVTMFPCNECAKLIIQSGIKTIVTKPPNLLHEKWGNSFKISIEMFKELGIEVIIIDDE